MVGAALLVLCAPGPGCSTADVTPDGGAGPEDALTPVDGGATTPDASPPDAADASGDAGTDAGPPPTSMRALFVGNSYTSVNDLPSVVAELARANGVLLETEVIAPGGANLCDHFGTGETVERIGSGDHDAVVIQGQSVDVFYDGESAHFCGRHLGVHARDAGADLVWFATWARREGHEFYSRGRGVTTPEEMTDVVEGFYRNISRFGPGGHVARVGHGWERALAATDGVELHATDGSHPTPAGTLTAACTIAQGILGRTPELPSPAPFGLDETVARTLCDEATREPCFDELLFCGGECLSVAFDPMHCGACDAECGAPRRCWLSECSCPAAYTTPTIFAELAALEPGCAGEADAFGPDCAAAAHTACARTECATSGFGPFEREDGSEELVCVDGDVVPTTYTALAAFEPACDGVTERRGPRCATAIHRACVARGALSGFGPVEPTTGDDLTITCVTDGRLLSFGYDVLESSTRPATASPSAGAPPAATPSVSCASAWAAPAASGPSRARWTTRYASCASTRELAQRGAGGPAGSSDQRSPSRHQHIRAASAGRSTCGSPRTRPSS